jgi:ribosomal protein L11 methyltransferase
MHWIELSLDAAPEAIDWITTLLANANWDGGCSLVYAPIEPPTEAIWAFRVQLYWPNDVQARTRLDHLVQLLTPLQRTGLITQPEAATLPEIPAQPNLAYAIGQRFVILSPTAIAPAQDKILLRLEPSHAFGSGLHPATQLSLQLLERHVTAGMNTLDLGCGSGILSVAMAKLGARVLAIDTDAIAVRATQAAMQFNGVTAAVTVELGSLATGSTLGHWMGGDLPAPVTPIAAIARFDLIVANILARIHLALAADYRHALRQSSRQSGILITAGYALDYAAEVDQALSAVGFECVDRQQSQDWIALAHRLVD